MLWYTVTSAKQSVTWDSPYDSCPRPVPCVSGPSFFFFFFGLIIFWGITWAAVVPWLFFFTLLKMCRAWNYQQLPHHKTCFVSSTVNLFCHSWHMVYDSEIKSLSVIIILELKKKKPPDKQPVSLVLLSVVPHTSSFSCSHSLKNRASKPWRVGDKVTRCQPPSHISDSLKSLSCSLSLFLSLFWVFWSRAGFSSTTSAVEQFSFRKSIKMFM